MLNVFCYISRPSLLRLQSFNSAPALQDFMLVHCIFGEREKEDQDIPFIMNMVTLKPPPDPDAGYSLPTLPLLLTHKPAAVCERLQRHASETKDLITMSVSIISRDTVSDGANTGTRPRLTFIMWLQSSGGDLRKSLTHSGDLPYTIGSLIWGVYENVSTKPRRTVFASRTIKALK